MGSAATEGTIEQWRGEIDRIDAQLVALLNRRAECALAIGAIKRRDGIPVYVAERERAVIESVKAANRGPLSGTAIEAIYQAVIGHTRLLEERSAATHS